MSVPPKIEYLKPNKWGFSQLFDSFSAVSDGLELSLATASAQFAATYWPEPTPR